jgi:hypothetical protein
MIAGVVVLTLVVVKPGSSQRPLPLAAHLDGAGLSRAVETCWAESCVISRTAWPRRRNNAGARMLERAE